MPVASIALILGVDRFMSEARALTNLVGNGVATIVVAKWEGALDEERMHAHLDRETDQEADEPETVLVAEEIDRGDAYPRDGTEPRDGLPSSGTGAEPASRVTLGLQSSGTLDRQAHCRSRAATPATDLHRPFLHGMAASNAKIELRNKLNIGVASCTAAGVIQLRRTRKQGTSCNAASRSAHA